MAGIYKSAVSVAPKTPILSTLFTKKTTQKSKEMISCDSCGTFVHEDLLISRFGKKYCSKECTNS